MDAINFLLQYNFRFICEKEFDLFVQNVTYYWVNQLKDFVSAIYVRLCSLYSSKQGSYAMNNELDKVHAICNGKGLIVREFIHYVWHSISI